MCIRDSLQLHRGLEAPLPGVNAGGCGTLIASLASVISYKLYAAQHPGEGGRYLLLFTGYNVLFLLVLTVLGLFLI